MILSLEIIDLIIKIDKMCESSRITFGCNIPTAAQSLEQSAVDSKRTRQDINDFEISELIKSKARSNLIARLYEQLCSNSDKTIKWIFQDEHRYGHHYAISTVNIFYDNRATSCQDDDLDNPKNCTMLILSFQQQYSVPNTGIFAWVPPNKYPLSFYRLYQDILDSLQDTKIHESRFATNAVKDAMIQFITRLNDQENLGYTIIVDDDLIRLKFGN